MANPPPKKRTCRLCSTEHNVGEECPNCEWNEEKEELRAKAVVEREKMAEEVRKAAPKTKKKGFLDF